MKGTQMTTTNQTVKVYRGDTATVSIAVTQADGTPLAPATTIKWWMALTSHASEGEALVRKELGSGIELAEGGIAITLGAADTDFPPGVYHHELKVFEVGGDVATAMVGAFVVKRALRMVV